MKLKQLRVRNFRCFKDEISIDFEDITALVGKNEAGKSTLMDALNIFLNEGNPDNDDASKDGDPKDLTIICEFDNLPDEVILDDTSPTNLSSEHLLSAENRLEIHKCYSGELQSPKCKSVEAYAIHPTIDGAEDLLQLKNADLKKRARELGISLDGVDQRVNSHIRARIWDSLDDLHLTPSMIPLNEDNAKKIWTELRKYLPAFALFKSDRASTDQDPEAQDPLKSAVKEAIKAKEAELEAITEYVRDKVKEIANLTLKKIQEMDPTLATQLNPNFSSLKWDSLFKASLTSDEDIPINKRGSGVKRLILLNFFRAKAEQLAKEKSQSYIIYAIEEPETSQHPNNQRILIRTLSDLSTEAQVIISTHTPMLARVLPDSSLRYIQIREDKGRDILIGSNETNKKFVQALGVLPDNNVKLFIGVEGPTDIAFLRTMSKMLHGEDRDIPDLEKMELDGEVIFFPLGGSNLALWSSRLEHLNRPEFHLYDRNCAPPEPAKYQSHVDEVNAREKCRARSTLKKEIENYLHKDAIIAAYEQLPITITIDTNFSPYDDVPREVARLVHEVSDSSTVWDDLSEEKKIEKESRAKHILCTIAPNYMNKTLLSEIDPDNDLLQWFKDIIDLCGSE